MSQKHKLNIKRNLADIVAASRICGGVSSLTQSKNCVSEHEQYNDLIEGSK